MILSTNGPFYNCSVVENSVLMIVVFVAFRMKLEEVKIPSLLLQ